MLSRLNNNVHFINFLKYRTNLLQTGEFLLVLQGGSLLLTCSIFSWIQRCLPVCSFGIKPHWGDVRENAWGSYLLREKALLYWLPACVCPPSPSTVGKGLCPSLPDTNPRGTSTAPFTERLLGFCLLQVTEIPLKLVEKINRVYWTP